MAATSGAIRAGRAFVEIFGDDSALDRTLKNVQRKLTSFGSVISKAGAALVGIGSGVVAPLVGAAVAFAKAGAAIDDAAGRTGVSAEALQELAFAAEQSGAGLGDVEAGLRAMARFEKQAEDGAKGAAAAMKELGLPPSLMGLTPAEQMAAFAEALSKVEDPTRRAALAMQIFGKAGTKLLPMFANGADGLAAFAAQAHELGLVMSEEDIKAAAELDDTLTALWSQLGAVGGAIGAAVAPMLLSLAGQIQQVAGVVIEWVRNNRELVTTVLMAAVALMVVGGIVVGIGTTFVALGAVIGGVATVFGLIGTVIGALLSPIGLVVAALVGLGAWFVTSTEAGAAAVEGLRSVFGELGTEATTTFDAIKTALSSGDFSAAAAVLWAAVKLEWTKGVNFLSGIWDGFVNGARGMWLEFTDGIVDAWETAVNAIAKVVEYISAFFETGSISDAIAEGDKRAAALDASLQESIGQRMADRNAALASAGGGDTSAAEAELAAAKAAWQSAVEAVKTTPAADAQAVTAAGGGGLGNVGGSTAVASVGTFSNMAGRTLAGPNSAVMAAMNQQTDLLREIRDNTTEQEG